MLVFRRVTEHQARLLSSNMIYDRLIYDDDIFEKISSKFDFSFVYDEVKDLYCPDNGRPNEDPVRLFKASLVQRSKCLSDEQMEQAARYDIRIKHFLSVPIEDYGFDYSTLSRFRTRLGPERFEQIFQKILKQISGLGIIKNPKKQFMDSMPVFAHAALPSVGCLVYQGISEVLRSVSDDLRMQIYEATELDDDKLKNYTKPHPLFRLEPSEKKKFFDKAVDKARTVIETLERVAHQSEELDQLRQILNENVDEKNQQIQTVKAIKTLVDKDAKLGHKTQEDMIFGYKNNATVTEEGIITAVEVTSAAERDDKQTDALLKKTEQVNLKPDEVDADSAYGFIETYKTAEANGVILNAPFRGLDENKISIYELEYDEKNNALTCLNNVTVKGTADLRFEFPIRTCRSCPRYKQCPISNSKRVKLNKDHEVARRTIERQRKKAEQRKADKENGVKTKSRLIIENVFAYLEKMRGKKTPYIGIKKATIHILLVATMSNIMKTVRLAG
jgi:transposase